LQSAPLNGDGVRYEWFRQACLDYQQYQQDCGAPYEHMNDVDWYVQPGDLQTFVNVVSWWPKHAPKGFQAPYLYKMMLECVSPGARTFVQVLDDAKERLRPWMEAKRVSFDNPNESREEKKKRLNREGVARYRANHAPEPSDDPELAELMRACKAAQDNVAKGRAYVKGVERDAKAVYDAAVLAAKVARADTVSAAQAHLLIAEQHGEACLSALTAYKAS
jgi:hypothetical protein